MADRYANKTSSDTQSDSSSMPPSLDHKAATFNAVRAGLPFDLSAVIQQVSQGNLALLFAAGAGQSVMDSKNSLGEPLPSHLHISRKAFRARAPAKGVGSIASLSEKLKAVPKQKQYACLICQYVTRHQNGLDYHMKKVHGKGETYSCSVCEYTCVDKQHLTQHFRQHTGEKPFNCDFCDYRSASKAGLRYHIRTHHDQKSLITCVTCGYKAYNTYILTQHLRKHSGDKPFRCDECALQFSVKASLNHHNKTKHGITDSLCGPDQTGEGSHTETPCALLNTPGSSYSEQVEFQNVLPIPPLLIRTEQYPAFRSANNSVLPFPTNLPPQVLGSNY